MSQATLLMMGLLLVAAALVPPAAAQEPEDGGWISLFNGKDLTGWKPLHVGGESGGKWEVIDGALCGRQYPPGKGGYLSTEQTFSDFELIAEINPDFGIDSGIFFRCPPNSHGYQITIDYRPGGQTGTLYCGGWLAANPDWEKHYKKDTWNTIRLVCTGSPPHIQAWLNGNQTVDFTDDKADRRPREGGIALQLHGGGDWGGKMTRFKSIRVRRLEE